VLCGSIRRWLLERDGATVGFASMYQGWVGAACGLLTLGGWGEREDMVDKAALGTLHKHNPCTSRCDGLDERVSKFAFCVFFFLLSGVALHAMGAFGKLGPW
jgi:hypothetical protein